MFTARAGRSSRPSVTHGLRWASDDALCLILKLTNAPVSSTKRHLFKHTEIYISSEMIAYAPQDIFQTLPVPVRLCNYKKELSPFLIDGKGDKTIVLIQTLIDIYHTILKKCLLLI